jgi:hypothetical protein
LYSGIRSPRMPPSLETMVKIYTGVTCVYGLVRTHHTNHRPIDRASIVVAAPLLWPAFLASDLFDGHRHCTRRFQHPMSDDT